MKQLVSIIITTYSRSKFIEKAITSALYQTYTNTEIIIVDDNAENINEREKTKKIVNKYKDKVIYIENEKNLGAALSRNVGVKRAQGKFIAFLDDDDEYEKNKIQEQYDLYMQHKENAGLIYCAYYIIDNNERVIGKYENNGSNLLYDNMITCIAPTSLWFCPKHVIEECGLFEKSPRMEDSILILKILLKGYKIYKVPKELVFYREHEDDSRMSGLKIVNIEGLLNYRRICRKYYSCLTKKEKKNVEYNFSKQLVTLYTLNGMKMEALKETIHMIMQNPLNKNNLFAIYKICFTNLYKRKIRRAKYDNKKNYS